MSSTIRTAPAITQTCTLPSHPSVNTNVSRHFFSNNTLSNWKWTRFDTVKRLLSNSSSAPNSFPAGALPRPAGGRKLQHSQTPAGRLGRGQPRLILRPSTASSSRSRRRQCAETFASFFFYLSILGRGLAIEFSVNYIVVYIGVHWANIRLRSHAV